MADNEFDSKNPNEAAGFSAFGGHILNLPINTTNEPKNAVQFEDNIGISGRLQELGIEDAEQLVAIAVIPEIRKELKKVLEIKEKDFSVLLKKADSVLSRTRSTLVSDPADNEFGRGVLPPTPEILEAAEHPLASDDNTAHFDVVLPSSVNLIPFMPPVRNQASRGTCVAFTLTALNEYVLSRRNINIDLSEQHLYFETKQTDGEITRCGTWLTKAAIILQNRGQAREHIWTYNPNPPCNNHGFLPPQARPDAMNFRLSAFSIPARDVNAYKTQLAMQRPVAISIPMYNSWFQSAETRRSGRINLRIGGEPVIDGHAVCLVGYQDNPTSPGGGFFILRNSWGNAWGIECPYGSGYGVIPYQYITNDSWEAFTALVSGISDSDINLMSDVPEKNEEVTIKVGSTVITIKSSDKF